MAIEHMDGFDHYNTSAHLALKWSGVANAAGTFGAGRFGGQAFTASGTPGTGARMDLTAQATRVVGFALKLPNTTTGGIIVVFGDGATTQVDVRWSGTAAGLLTVTRNGTVLGTASGTYAQGVWYYLEFKALIDPSAGEVYLHIDGASVLALTAQNTRNTANSYSTRVTISTSAAPAVYTFDDLYILNTSGSINNDFLGECRIITSVPNADGSSLQWTPSTGTAHWSLVDEIPPNATDHVLSSTPGHIDLLVLPDIAPTGPVLAAQTVIMALKDDVGVRQIAEQCKSGATTGTGATETMTSTNAFYKTLRETDPATSAQWTLSGFNAAEWGAKVIA
jgi:hypothetical protein